MTEGPEKSVVVRFPKRRALPWPGRTDAPARNLGLTPLSQALGPVGLSPKGHWCDRCEGIWYSYFGEARCPACNGKC
jgi:hypothetical protein